MITSALDSMSIPFTEQSGQIIIDCPFCNEPKHLYIDPGKRVFFCHKCKKPGTWRELSEALGGSPSVGIQPVAKKQYKHPTEEYVASCHKKLLGPSGTKAIEYLYARKITLDAIHFFKIGLDKKEGADWIAIPYFSKGKPVNVKYRSIPPDKKDFRRWEGGESTLFNQDVLKDLKDEDTVIITEGEFDTLALYSQGIKNAVSTSVGANAVKPEWIDTLDRFRDIVIAYDNDEPGQKGAKELGKRLDLDRCRNMILPEKDANDFFMSGKTVDEFKSLLAGATYFPVENIQTMEQVFKDLMASYDEKAKSTSLKPQWKSVERIMGPYEDGDLIVLSATPKTGKTSLALNEAVHHAQAGHPVLFFCLEMRPERILKKCFQIVGRISEDSLNPSIMIRLYGEIADIPLYSGYVYKKCSLDVVVDTIKLGMKRYGFKLIIFDNLHFLARSMTHQVQEIGLITKTFKMLAEELGVPIILIAQPRKIDDDRVMSMNDLKDSSSIGADADTVVILYRKKATGRTGETEIAFEPETLVRVDASRFHAGGETVLYFTGATGVFSELARDTE